MTVYDAVKEILEICPEARNSDNTLYVKYIECIDSSLLNKSFKDIMLNRRYYQLPSYETISRARRKIQEAYPSLQADANAKKLRIMQSDNYHAIWKNDWDKLEELFKERGM